MILCICLIASGFLIDDRCVAVTAYGKLYLMGGFSPSTGLLSGTIVEYDPQTGIWTSRFNMTTNPLFRGALFYDGLIYLVGGGERFAVNTYNPLTNQWGSRNSLPAGAYNLYNINNNLVATISGTPFVLTYQPSSDTWQDKNSPVLLYGANTSQLHGNIYEFDSGFALQYQYASNTHNIYQTFIEPDIHSTCAAGDKIFVFAGNANYANRLLEYEPPVSSWIYMDDVLPVFSAFSSGAVINDEVYIAGGHGGPNTTGFTLLNNLYRFTPGQGISTLQSMPTAVQMGASAVLNGEMYVIGGTPNGAYTTNRAQIYNPVNNTWRQETADNYPLSLHSMAAAAHDGKIYVFGGKSTSGSFAGSNAVWEYNPTANPRWRSRANMSPGRYAAHAVTIGDKIYVIGGVNANGIPINTVDVYDPVANSWDATKANLPEGVAYAAITTDGAQIYLVGGAIGATVNSLRASPSVYQYNPVADVWLTWPGPDVARYGGVAALLSDGIYLFNGNTPTGGYYLETLFTPLVQLQSDIARFGDSRINPSGNLSRSFTDMSLLTPGFSLDISRTYNSRDTRINTMFGRGWTFGFQGKVETLGNDTVARLPNGGAMSFRVNANGTYTARDSRATLVKNSNNTWTLTTKDRYIYNFNANGYLNQMTDRNGNSINITVQADGRVTNITDPVGRAFTVNYTTTSGNNRRISNITDGVRTVSYGYDSNFRLTTVTDPSGVITRYTYDANGYLASVRDHANTAVESFTHNTPQGETLPKLRTLTDHFSNVETYVYNTVEGIVTATDSNNRVTTTWFDTSLYPIRVLDADNKETLTEYNLDNGINRWGEPRMIRDRNGNATYYDRDARGNVERIVNPDNSERGLQYDTNDNLVREVDEDGRRTYFVYDANNNLLRTARPLTVTAPAYNPNGNQDHQNMFAVTVNTYITRTNMGTAGNLTVRGLLATVTDPEGNTTTFAHDIHGNVASQTNALNRTTNYVYNSFGWLMSETSPRNNSVRYFYDRAGRLLKKETDVDDISGISFIVERFVYDANGRLTQQIAPAQYASGSDTAQFDTRNILSSGAYSAATHGYRYVYNTNSTLQSETDAEGYRTQYTSYDRYGNVLIAIMPDSTIREYQYDILNRLTHIRHRDAAGLPLILLEEFTYAILANGQTTQAHRVHFDAANSALTTTTFDYAGRNVRIDMPDGTHTRMIYNRNGTLRESRDGMGHSTFYTYDTLNRQIATWTPVEANKFQYAGTEYDKAGRAARQMQGKNVITVTGEPTAANIPALTDCTWTFTEYNADNTVSRVTTSGGGRTDFLNYDEDGNPRTVRRYSTATAFDEDTFTYNSRGMVATKTQRVAQRDLYAHGQSTSDTLVSLTTTYLYDRNSNLASEKNSADLTTTYQYDNLNRLRVTTMPWLDGGTVTNETTYNWRGQPLTQKDGRGNDTVFQYDLLGHLARITNAEGDVHLFEHDRAGRVIREVTPQNFVSGNAITNMSRIEFEYDPMGRLIRKIDIYRDPFDNNNFRTVTAEAYQYDAGGRLVKELSAEAYNAATGATPSAKIENGLGTVYVYDWAGQLLSMRTPVAQEKNYIDVQYQYDGLGRKERETNASGNVTIIAYDDHGNLLSATALGFPVAGTNTVMFSNEYDLLDRLLTATDARGNTTAYTYNAFDKVRAVTLPGDANIPAHTTTHRYDTPGRLVHSIDTLNKEILIIYDHQDRVRSKTERKSDGSESITLTWKYDKNGNPTEEKDGNGTVFTHVYDKANRRETSSYIVNGVAKTTTSGYDKAGNLLTTTDWLGNVWRTEYDPLSRAIRIFDPYSTTVPIETLKYNLDGNQVESIYLNAEGHSRTKIFAYDKNGRLLSTVIPYSASVSITESQTYDNLGNVNTMTDGRGVVTAHEYNRFGWLINVRTNGILVATYTYDNKGNLLTQRDGSNTYATFAYEYNARNLVRLRRDAESGTETSNYYADGNVRESVDLNGNTTTHVYDIHGRLRQKSIGTEVISYTYDDNNNLLTMTDATGVTTRTYDAENRVLTKRVNTTATTTAMNEYQYDIRTGLSAGYVAERLTDLKGNVVTTVFDKCGRLAEVRDGSRITVHAYNANGSLKSITYPGGTSEHYTYYDNHMLKTLENRLSNGNIRSAYNYDYDGAGNMLTKLDGEGTTAYLYDDLGRLEKVTEPNGRITIYTYDNSGNRETETVTQGGQTVVITYSYDRRNRLEQTETEQPNGVIKVVDFFYDANGNMTGRLNSTLTPAGATPLPPSLSLKLHDKDNAIYEYDVWNNMISATTDGETTTMTYNGDGLRVTKTAKGLTTRYIYEYSDVILELDATGNQMARNVFGNRNISRTTGSTTVYFLHNGQGDVTGLVDNSGSVVATYYYDAFGNHLNTTANSNNPYRYRGYTFDEATGLYYLKARFYDPELARFMQEDTYRGRQADPLSLNLYTYAHNNPVKYYDPTGYAAVWFVPGIGYFDSNWKQLRGTEFNRAPGDTGSLYRFTGPLTSDGARPVALVNPPTSGGSGTTGGGTTNTGGGTMTSSISTGGGGSSGSNIVNNITFVPGIGYFDGNWNQLRGAEFSRAPGDTGSSFAFGSANSDGTWTVVHKSTTLVNAESLSPADKDKKLNLPAELPILRRGDSGDSVRELQRHLINLGYNLGTHGADGQFGLATQRAVEAFQRDNGLTVDGSVGSQTWGTLAVRILPNDPNVTYYIYCAVDPVLRGHGERNIAHMREQGRTVHGIPMHNGVMFEAAWNALPETMDTLIIALHGFPGGIYRDRGLGDLAPKTIDTLFTLACNSAHQNFDNNFANQLLARHTIRQLVGYDGRSGFANTAPNIHGGRWRGEAGANFTNHARPQGREPLGAMLYINGTVNPIAEEGQRFTSIDEFLRFIGK
jgi:RHS repeat-associated protein